MNAPTLSQHARCTEHRHSLLTHDGTCPACVTKARMDAERSADAEREHRRLQALTRVTAGKRRAPTLPEVLR